MEFRQLKIFCAAAQDLNFTETARKLDYVQSNITSQIKQLENELDTKLFDRLGKRVVLSNEGKIFLDYACKILSDCEEAKKAIAPDEYKGSIRIGASETSCVCYLPNILKKYHAKYPLVEIHIDTIACKQTPELLQTNAIDIALLMTNFTYDLAFCAETISNEPMVFVTGLQHHLARTSTLEAVQLSDECLILTSPICGYRPFVVEMLKNNGIQPSLTMELASVTAIKECLSCGLGFAVLPEIAVREELKCGKLAKLNISKMNLMINNQLLYHKDKWLSPAIQAFIDLCKSTESVNV